MYRHYKSSCYRPQLSAFRSGPIDFVHPWSQEWCHPRGAFMYIPWHIVLYIESVTREHDVAQWGDCIVYVRVWGRCPDYICLHSESIIRAIESMNTLDIDRFFCTFWTSKTNRDDLVHTSSKWTSIVLKLVLNTDEQTDEISFVSEPLPTIVDIHC